MKAGKCTNCGANIVVDETKDAGICEYCNTAFVTEKAINQVNNTTNNAQTIINNYYTGEKPRKSMKVNEEEDDDQDEDKRPEINIAIAVLLCWLYIVPGLIYIILTKQKQKEWDKAHGINN